MPFHRSSGRTGRLTHGCARLAFRISTLTLVTVLAGLILASQSFAATYAGTNTGAIADGTTVCGASRDVQFAVSGFSGTVGSVSVQFTMSTVHTYVGDLVVTLIAPNSTGHVVMGRVGSTAGSPFGDDSNVLGPYTFSDITANNIWAAAATAGSNGNVASNSYRTQPSGPAANANPGPVFSTMIATFSTVPPASVNGTWILRFQDCAAQDTGAVGSASLTLIPLAAAPASIAGRAVTSAGKGIRNVLVTVSGGNLIEPVTVNTGSFGYFRFDGLEAGQAYIVSVRARRYVFENPTMLVNLGQNVDGMTFVASP